MPQITGIRDGHRIITTVTGPPGSATITRACHPDCPCHTQTARTARRPEESLMSTNYYAFGPFSGGEPDGEGLHIGKTSAGWVFLGRAHDELGLTSREAWTTFLEQPGVTILNEYGRDVPVTEMVETMAARRGSDGRLLHRHGFRTALGAHPGWADRCLVDAEGYEFSRQEFR